MHAAYGLRETTCIYLLTLTLITQVIFVLEYGKTHTQTHKVADETVHPTPTRVGR